MEDQLAGIIWAIFTLAFAIISCAMFIDHRIDKIRKVLERIADFYERQERRDDANL
jgi:hypothetical protein